MIISWILITIPSLCSYYVLPYYEPDPSFSKKELRDMGIPLDSLILSEHLDKYAETGEQYVDVLKKIIKQNNLKDFDDAKLLPSSIELESLI